MAAKKTRKARIKRETAETQISLSINLDGSGKVKAQTPYGFIDHMLTAMHKHALIDLSVKVEGDIEVDAHHTFEDLGIVLGEAFLKAVGDKKGITRFGFAAVPMDEALATATVDISGRPYLVYDAKIPKRKQWEFDCNLVNEFFLAFASSARLTLHIKLEYGDNYHHACEAMFKAAGRALRQAVEMDQRVKGVPSSKGTL
jgi:imidazoleglycerol-phosphate dehydratase